MKYLSILLILAPLSLPAKIKIWQGWSLDPAWSNGENWSDGTAPTHSDIIEIKDNADHQVDINSQIAGRYNLQARSGVLNINPGGKLSTLPSTVAETGDFSGAGLTNDSTSIINIKGSPDAPAILEINHSFAVRYGHTDINIGNDGLFEVLNGGDGGRIFRFYHDIDEDIVIGKIKVSGNGIFRNVANTEIQAEGNSAFYLRDQATFTTNSVYNMGSGPDIYEHVFSVTGSQVQTDIATLKAYVQHPESDAYFEFIADSNGISTLNIYDLQMNLGSKNVKVIIQTGELTGARHTLTLVRYAYMTSGAEFESIQALGGNYKIDSIDYTADGGTAIKVELSATL